MDASWAPELELPDPEGPVVTRHRSNHGLRRALPFIGMMLGSAIVVLSYSMADFAVPGQKEHFAVFWVGTFLFLVPAGWRLLSHRTAAIDRYVLILGVGMFTYVPKFLAYPYRPAYFDEVGHWIQVERLTDDGLLFVKNNQIVVISDYPAMHMFAAGVRHLTGIPTIVIAIIMLVVLHAVALVGIYVLAKTITGSEHAGSTAAFFYSIGPGFWFFSSQFSYESYGIVVLIWGTAAMAKMLTSDPVGWTRTSWMLIVVFIEAVLVATHHLTSYMFVIVIGAYAGAALVFRLLRRDTTLTMGESFFVLGVAIAMTAGWLIEQAPGTQAYVAPFISGGAGDVVAIFGGGAGLEEPEGLLAEDLELEEARELFAGSTLPMYEIIMGFVSILILPLLALFSGIVQLKKALLDRAIIFAMTLFAAAYFVVYPLMLSVEGAEIARRSWSFTSIGLAVMIGSGFQVISHIKEWWKRAPLMGVTIVMFMGVLMGNLATGINEVYRFPGVYVYGSDTRSTTLEIQDAARWFQDTQGPNQRLIGDRTIQMWFNSLGKGILGVPDGGNRLWDFVLAENEPDAQVLHAARSVGLRWVIIDERQAQYKPFIGFYLDQNEPLATERVEPLPESSVSKYDDIDWVIRVYSSERISIYRLDLSAVEIQEVLATVDADNARRSDAAKAGLVEEAG